MHFLKKIPIDREKGKSKSYLVTNIIHVLAILLWFVDTVIVEAAISRRILIDEIHIETKPEKLTAPFIDENVYLEVCKKYYTRNGWLALKYVIKTIKSNPIYYCGSCTKSIDEETENSIQCDNCFIWYHFGCINLIRKPKSHVWFCRSCY